MSEDTRQEILRALLLLLFVQLRHLYARSLLVNLTHQNIKKVVSLMVQTNFSRAKFSQTLRRCPLILLVYLTQACWIVKYFFVPCSWIAETSVSFKVPACPSNCGSIEINTSMEILVQEDQSTWKYTVPVSSSPPQTFR